MYFGACPRSLRAAVILHNLLSLKLQPSLPGRAATSSVAMRAVHNELPRRRRKHPQPPAAQILINNQTRTSTDAINNRQTECKKRRLRRQNRCQTRAREGGGRKCTRKGCRSCGLPASAVKPAMYPNAHLAVAQPCMPSPKRKTYTTGVLMHRHPAIAMTFGSHFNLNMSKNTESTQCRKFCPLQTFYSDCCVLDPANEVTETLRGGVKRTGPGSYDVYGTADLTVLEGQSQDTKQPDTRARNNTESELFEPKQK